MIHTNYEHPRHFPFQRTIKNSHNQNSHLAHFFLMDETAWPRDFLPWELWGTLGSLGPPFPGWPILAVRWPRASGTWGLAAGWAGRAPSAGPVGRASAVPSGPSGKDLLYR